MALATLSIDIEARLAKFEGDLGKAQRSLDRLAEGARGSFARIGEIAAGTSIGTAITDGIAQLVNAFPQLIDGVARFQDLAEETNASAAGLASFRTAADVSGVQVEQLAGFMVKLTGNLSKVTKDTTGAGQALRLLGIDYKAFRELRPDEQIGQLAKAFNGAADSGTKIALALALFGRGGSSVLRFFKEYEAQGGAIVRLSDEQIQAADAYADSQARVRSELRQAAEEIAVSTLPAMNALAGAAVDLAGQLFGVTTAGRDLQRENAILDWAEGAAIAVGTVADSIVGLVKLARAIGGSFQAVAADIALPFKIAAAAAGSEGSSFQERARGVVAAILDRNKTVTEANERYVDLWNYNGTAVSDAIRKSFADQRRLLNNPPAAPDKPTGRVLGELIPPDTEAERAAAARASQYAQLVDQIRERTAAAQLELDTGQKLNDVDSFALGIRSKLAKETSLLSDAQRAEVETLLQTFVAVGKANTAQAESLKLRQAESRQVAQDIAQRAASNKSLADENQAIGLNADQLEQLRITRLELALAKQEEKTATLELFGAEADLLGQQGDIADALREEIRLRKEGIATRKAQEGDGARGQRAAIDEFMKGITDKAATTKRVTTEVLSSLESDLVTSFRTGEFTARKFADTVIDELLRINVVKPALAWLTSGAGGGSVFSSLIGFITGSAKGNAWAGGQIQAFARGGIMGPLGGMLSRPTLFPMGAGAWGVGGEAGTEAVLPLARGAGGKLGVMISGGGGQAAPIVNQYLSVGAGVTRPEVMSLLQAYGTQLKGEILSSVRGGGAFAGS